MNEISTFDQALFMKINGAWTHPWLDQMMPIITDLHRQPLFSMVLLPLLLAAWIYRQKSNALKLILMLVVAIALSDLISYRILKPWANRERPSNSGVEVTLRTERHSGKSFPSNHAANNFAAAVILSFAFPQARLLFFFIATMIAYSRIYVGVHYPLDVIGGALLGLSTGYFVVTIGHRWRPLKLNPAQASQPTRSGAGSSRERS